MLALPVGMPQEDIHALRRLPEIPNVKPSKAPLFQSLLPVRIAGVDDVLGAELLEELYLLLAPHLGGCRKRVVRMRLIQEFGPG